MTIKEFARLCGCNPQTLRYYDHVDLLKPVKVDQWSGYRYYDEDQALAFVRIKNLQKAGFTIDEIKELLDKDNHVIYKAFDAKIAEEEKRLQEIKAIQKSYQTEMDQIQEKINEARKKITQAMHEYDPTEEFGISSDEYAGIIDNVNSHFDNIVVSDINQFDFEEFHHGEGAVEEQEYLDFLHNPEYEVVFEKHGWSNVKDFIDEFINLEDGAEYALYIRVTDEKAHRNIAFANTILGVLLARNPEKKKSLACDIEKSEDGQNHFWFLKRKK